jgi:hypothetical protein
MPQQIAYCGIPCTQCPTFVATRKDDQAARDRVAEEWSKQFGMTLTASDINCDGCLSQGPRLFGHCNACEIRRCGQERGVENCAHCPDYACDTLTAFWKLAPYAKAPLEKIRRG